VEGSLSRTLVSVTGVSGPETRVVRPTRTACLRTAAGLSPGRADTSGKPIVPLYARDAAVREEICDNCEQSLYDLLAAGRGTPEPKPVTAQLRGHGKHTALEFDRVRPPVEIRTALNSSGWRWDPRLRVWWSDEEVPRVPAGVVLPIRESRKPRRRGPSFVGGAEGRARRRARSSARGARVTVACEDVRHVQQRPEDRLPGSRPSSGVGCRAMPKQVYSPRLRRRELFWVGTTLDDVRAFPEEVRREVGHALHLAQLGEKSPSAKPLRGFKGAGVLEVVETDGQARHRHRREAVAGG